MIINYFILILYTLVLSFNLIEAISVQVEPLDNNNGKIKAVVMVWRHGERAPGSSFPNDKYFDPSYWPMGYGQLTNLGLKQQYRLGRWAHQRYKEFLSENYSREEIYVHCSNLTRNVMSAISTLAGMYPSKNFWKYENDIDKINMEVFNSSVDDVMTELRECRKFKQMFKAVKNDTNDAMKRIYAEFFEDVSSKTGWTDVTFGHVKKIYGLFRIYRSYNPDFLPRWVETLNKHTLEYLADVFYVLPTNNTELSRLCVGPFFGFISDYFDARIKSSGDVNPKIIMLSGHSSIMANSLRVMNLYSRPVRFSDALIWELRERKDGSFYVNVLHKPADKHEEELNVLGCGFNCDYDKYKMKLSDIIISLDNWKTECNNVDT